MILKVSSNPNHSVIRLFSKVTVMRENALKLCRGRFRLDNRKSFFSYRVVTHQYQLPREVGESPSHRGVALRDTVSGHGGCWLELDSGI